MLHSDIWKHLTMCKQMISIKIELLVLCTILAINAPSKIDI